MGKSPHTFIMKRYGRFLHPKNKTSRSNRKKTPVSNAIRIPLKFV